MATCIRAIGAKGRCKGTESTPTACTACTPETGNPRFQSAHRVLPPFFADAGCDPVRACFRSARGSCTNLPGRVLASRYEGGYFRGQRQGSGVYRYAGKGGGVYLGEWLNGQMDGHGMMMYPDGEFYVGTWRRDKKEGLGVRPPSLVCPLCCYAMMWGEDGAGAETQVYIWGHSAGAGSGDRYEGKFLDGLSHGLGRTVFSAGGNHRVLPTQ
jgi:hypothetical protein